jgi:Mg/Co/Ni transporter MgtE
VPKKKTKSEPDAFSDAPSVSDALSNLAPRSSSIGTEGTHRPSTSRSTDGDTDNDNSTEFLTLSDGGTVLDEAWKRGTWLLGLLVLQSSSSVVLEKYADLVKDHIEITLFLTMLVGAGGNAGNQSAISVIRGLATGTIQPTFSCALETMWRQTRVGVALASVLSAGGFIRVLASRAAFADAGDVAAAVSGTDPALVAAIGIATSLFAIVTASTLTGSALPFALAAAGQDPANAGTTIQVCMDVAGVVITCVVCSFVFEYFGGVAELGSTVVGVATGLS